MACGQLTALQWLGLVVWRAVFHQTFYQCHIPELCSRPDGQVLLSILFAARMSLTTSWPATESDISKRMPNVSFWCPKLDESVAKNGSISAVHVVRLELR